MWDNNGTDNNNIINENTILWSLALFGGADDTTSATHCAVLSNIGTPAQATTVLILSIIIDGITYLDSGAFGGVGDTSDINSVINNSYHNKCHGNIANRNVAEDAERRLRLTGLHRLFIRAVQDFQEHSNVRHGGSILLCAKSAPTRLVPCRYV